MFFSSPAWDSVVYWALDLETGGLDPKRDPIVALGMLPIRGGRVRLGEGYRTLVRPADGRAIDPHSVRAHQLVWGEVKDAPEVAEVLPEVDRRLAEGAHLARPELPADPPALNLSAARELNGLPPYQAHDALTDALATAELFLVLRHALGARTLRDLR